MAPGSGEPLATEKVKWNVWPRKDTLGAFVAELLGILTDQNIDGPVIDQTCTFNWQSDWAYCGDSEVGALLAEENFGALPGDGLVTHVFLLLPVGTVARFEVATDYTQSTLTVAVWGPDDHSTRGYLASVAAAVEQFYLDLMEKGRRG